MVRVGHEGLHRTYVMVLWIVKMRLRGARKADTEFIAKLYDEYDFKLDPSHLQIMIVAEDDNGSPIAVMSLNTVIECSFLTIKESRKRDKIEALKRLVEQGMSEVKTLGYDGTHAFANEKIAPTLKKHFGFVTAKGENLFLFVE